MGLLQTTSDEGRREDGLGCGQALAGLALGALAGSAQSGPDLNGDVGGVFGVHGSFRGAGVDPSGRVDLDLLLADEPLGVGLAGEGLRPLPAERIAVAGPVSATALLDEPHAWNLRSRRPGSPWERFGSGWERNQGIPGVLRGACR